jgi:hypothetical protein
MRTNNVLHKCFASAKRANRLMVHGLLTNKKMTHIRRRDEILLSQIHFSRARLIDSDLVGNNAVAKNLRGCHDERTFPN